MKTRLSGLVAVSLGCSVGACFDPPPPESSPTSSLIEKRQDAYSTVAVERIIPLRFLHLSENNPPTTSTSLDNINAAIDRANQVFRPAGVQFFLRSSEAHYTPNLINANVDCVDVESGNCPDFTPLGYFWTEHIPGASGPSTRTIGDDLLGIFPSAQNPGSSIDKTRAVWLVWAAKYRDPSEIIVWVSPTSFGNFSQGPNWNQMVFMSSEAITGTVKFAHELGHFFSLPHTFGAIQGPNYEAFINPETGSNSTVKDWWDLVFGDRIGSGSFNYFSSQNQANSWTSTPIFSIDRKDNCSFDSNNKVVCNVATTSGSSYSETLNHDHSAMLERSSFTSGNAENPSGNPPSFKYGANVMSYLGLDQDRPSSLSPSQVVMVRKTLRFNVQGASKSEFPGESSGRHLLGQYQNQSTAHRLDVDGDGRRDLVFYEPPVVAGDQGTFRILLSSRNYSTSASSSMTVFLGAMGDTPLVGDFDGDGRDDVAVWGRPSGVFSNPVWRWCISPSVPVTGIVTSCSGPQVTAFGTPTDIPLAGHRFSLSGPGFLAYYRPSTCSFSWRRTDTTTTQTVAMGGTCQRYRMPLPGLYDDDLLTDLVTYDPQQAQFRLVRSMGGYNPAQVLVRQFSPLFIAGQTGSSYARSGAVPVLGLFRSYRNYFLGAHGPWTNRLGLGLWQPWTGKTDILWNPIDFSSMDFSASFGGAGTSFPFSGQNGQVPFGGMGTNFANPSNGSACSKFAMYSPMKAISNTDNMLSIVETPVCTGTTVTGHTNIPLFPLQGGVRRVATPVADMDGDGLADILIYKSDTGQVVYLRSSTNFTTSSSTINAGVTARAVLL